LWEAALAAPWNGSPVWFHGDVAVENLLVRDGRLHAIIDFGCAGVGDPACDTVIAWTLFEGESRAAFRAGLPLDRVTWLRGRAWALWKALLILAHEHTRDGSTNKRWDKLHPGRTPPMVLSGSRTAAGAAHAPHPRADLPRGRS